MVSNTVKCAYTETYDLNTSVGELSILGIHTPQSPTLHRIFKGFFENYRKFRVVGCNFRMVCASQQALSPDMVGLEAGMVDPRDVLNPILFKACTGESFNALVDSAYDYIDKVGGSGTTKNASVDQITDNRTASIQAYYAMLSDNDWRKEHPQQGLTVTGLRPFVHKVVTTRPFMNRLGTSTSGDLNAPDMPYARSNAVAGFGINTPKPTSVSECRTLPNVFMSDGVTDMPWMDTAYISPEANTSEEPVVSSAIISRVPRTYCGVVVLPPAILQRLFFRLRIVWFVEFREFRPAWEIGPIDAQFMEPTEMDKQGMTENTTAYTYFNMYHTPSKLSDYSSLDVAGFDSVSEVIQSGQ